MHIESLKIHIAAIQQRIILEKDAEIRKKFENLKQLQKELVSTTASVKRPLIVSQTPTRAQKRLRRCEEKLQETRKQLEMLLPQGSGLLTLDEVKKEESLHREHLLEVKREVESMVSEYFSSFINV